VRLLYGYALLNSDSLCATIHNDLGVLCKTQGDLDTALVHYTKAYDVRRYSVRITLCAVLNLRYFNWFVSDVAV
jgi:hypothetical protein